MSTQLFYRGTVGGRPVALAFQAIAEASAEALVARLAFARLKRATAKPALNNAPAPADPLIFTVAERSTAGVDNSADNLDPSATATSPVQQLRRALTPEIELALNLPPELPASANATAALRPATFYIAPHAAPAQWLTRVHSELLHLFGLFTPALALHASSVLAPAANPTPTHGSPAHPPSAWIFCGPSGTGKTTISTVLLKTLPLVDEEIILVELPPAHTTPRAQILNGPHGTRVSIAGLFALKQSPHCAVSAISSGAFIAKNMTKPFGLDLPALLEQRLEKLAQLVAAELPRELAFNLNTAELLQTLTR